MHRLFFRGASGQDEHDLATAYGQGQTFFVTGIAVTTFAKESGLDIDAAHTGSHPLAPALSPTRPGEAIDRPDCRMRRGRGSRGAHWHRRPGRGLLCATGHARAARPDPVSRLRN